MLNEGFLFKGNRLCIPRVPMSQLFIKEMHRGSLVDKGISHLGKNRKSNQIYQIMNLIFFSLKFGLENQKLKLNRFSLVFLIKTK